MFVAEVGMAYDRRKLGKKDTIELGGDIHEYTELHGPKEFAGIPYLNDRELFDFNEHFIELGGPVQGRTFDFLIFGLLAVGMLIALMGVAATVVNPDGSLSRLPGDWLW